MKNIFTPKRTDWTSRLPEQVEKKEVASLGIEIYSYELNGKLIGLGFGGKRGKPDFYNSFSTPERRSEYINNYVKRVVDRHEQTVARKKEQTKPHTLVEGDILECSWGYDQTNIDFFQVTEVVSPRTVKIRGIQSQCIGNQSYQDKIVPVKDAFFPEGHYKFGKEQTKRVNSSNSVSIYSFASASKWDGRPAYQTASGYGH